MLFGGDLSDSYLKYACQLGADAIDGLPIPNEPGKGYCDLDQPLKIKKKIASWGMFINRTSLPYLSESYVDDGDMNMFKILLELRHAGFDGCLQPDHCPSLEGDSDETRQSLGYAVGYIKGMLASLASVCSWFPILVW